MVESNVVKTHNQMPKKFAKPTRKPRRRVARPARRRVAAPRRAVRPRVARVARVAGGVPRLIQSATGQASQTALTHLSRARRPAGITTMGAPSHYLVNKSDVYLCEPGKQLIFNLGQWNSIPDTIAMGALVPSSPTQFANAPVRYCVQGLQADCTITNSSTVTAYLDLYDVIATHDLPISSIVFGQVATPENAWLNGVELQALQTDPTGFTRQATLPGSRPTDSQLFKDFYKIKQHKSIILAPNGMHIHHVNIKTGRMFDVNQMASYSTIINGLAGYTMFTMGVLRGMPANGSEPVTGTTSGNPVLRSVTSERYTYSYVYRNGTTFAYGQTLPVPASINQLLLQSPGTGAPLSA